MDMPDTIRGARDILDRYHSSLLALREFSPRRDGLLSDAVLATAARRLSLIAEAGAALGERSSLPRNGTPDETLDALAAAVDVTVETLGVRARDGGSLVDELCALNLDNELDFLAQVDDAGSLSAWYQRALAGERSRALADD